MPTRIPDSSILHPFVSNQPPAVNIIDLTQETFYKQYVELNEPVVITGCQSQWSLPAGNESASVDAVRALCDVHSNAAVTNNNQQWCLCQLHGVLRDKVLMNVMISTSNAFKYYDLQLQSKADVAKAQPQQQEPSTSRSSMTLQQLVQYNASHSDTNAYLYGEAIPAELQPHFPPPSACLGTDDQLTSTMLWLGVADSGAKLDVVDERKEDSSAAQHACSVCHPQSAARDARTSPLHYDLSEGLLMQVIGIKRVWLFHPSLYERIPLHTVNSAHDRQSTLSCIHHPDNTKFADFVTAVQEATPDSIKYVELHPGDLLYISYGWFHQIESSGTNMSISYRWNPYEKLIQQHATTRRLFKQQLGSQELADTIYEQQLRDDLQLPSHVKQMLIQRVHA